MTEKSVAIVGGGLAGLAAAAAATTRGMRVEVFEQSKSLGGRAGSFFDSEIGQWIDYCQHVAMGCCDNFLDFCRRTGIDDCFERSAALHFIGPDGAQCDFAPCRWLPAPLHLLPGLMRLKYLSAGQRWGIVGALRKLARLRIESSGQWSVANGQRSEVRGQRSEVSNLPTAYRLPPTANPQSLIPNPSSSNPLPAGEGTIGAWLRRQGQSEQAIEQFWSVVLVSSLGETVDRASLAAAKMVFCKGFLASRGASDLLLPRLPLMAIFHQRVGKWLADRGATLHTETAIRQIDGDRSRARAVVLADGTRREFDFVIAAVPWRNVRTLFSENLLTAMPAMANVERIEPAAITAVHLWFDRPITVLPHAILVGRLGQWAFFKPFGDAKQHYCQVVISASHRLPARTRDEWLAAIRGELEAICPEARRAKLLHWRVTTQPAAVLSMQPEVDRFRLPQQTPLENLALAGDWTATGWPATMEGAVVSGYRAVEALR